MPIPKPGRAIALGLLLSTVAAAQNAPVPSPAPVPINTLNLTSLDDVNADENTIPTEALKTFVDVFDAVRLNYVETVSSQQLMENAIRGLLSRLDPHSAYMNQQEYVEFERNSDGDYAGIGVVLDMKAGSIRVVSALEGSPAAKAGLQSGDIINQINGQNVSELNLSEANRLLEGDVGSEVKLLIQRGESVSNVSIKREIIHTNSVSSRMLTENFAYIRISQFQTDTGERLQKEIEALRVKYPIRGIILDLRNNPGGLLESAVEVADLFLEQGTIVSVRGRNDTELEKYEATPGDLLNGASMVVLINAGSASGSEIVAGALQDNGRALVVGQPSFGKGSVQTITPLYHGGALKLTTARYFTPANKSIQAEGIRPQVLLNELRVKNSQDSGENTRESALPYHLRSLENASAAPSSDSQGEALAEQDFALYEALNLLTAVNIFAPANEQLAADRPLGKALGVKVALDGDPEAGGEEKAQAEEKVPGDEKPKGEEKAKGKAQDKAQDKAPREEHKAPGRSAAGEGKKP